MSNLTLRATWVGSERMARSRIGSKVPIPISPW